MARKVTGYPHQLAIEGKTLKGWRVWVEGISHPVSVKQEKRPKLGDLVKVD